MDALAGKAGATGCVKRLSEFSRLIVSASVQVGKHQAGAGGWRAAIGSGGISAAFTTTGSGGKAGDVLAQPASSIGKASSAARIMAGISCGTVHLGLYGPAAQGFGFSVRGFFFLCRLAGVGQLLRCGMARVGKVRAGVGKADPLPHMGGSGQGQGCGQCAGDHG
jgi:hypothetical protein